MVSRKLGEFESLTMLLMMLLLTTTWCDTLGACSMPQNTHSLGSNSSAGPERRTNQSSILWWENTQPRASGSAENSGAGLILCQDQPTLNKRRKKRRKRGRMRRRRQ